MLKQLFVERLVIQLTLLSLCLDFKVASQALAHHSPCYVTFPFLSHFLSTLPWTLSKWEIKIVTSVQFMLRLVWQWLMRANFLQAPFQLLPCLQSAPDGCRSCPGGVKPCVTCSHHPRIRPCQIPSEHFSLQCFAHNHQLIFLLRSFPDSGPLKPAPPTE